MIVEGIDKIASLAAVNRFGYSQDCGSAFCGFTLAGWAPAWAGIYSRKKTLKGKKISRMAFYWPTNPRTDLQQYNRQLLAIGMNFWANLTDLAKENYNELARKRYLIGYNLFLKEFLRAPGHNLVGYSFCGIEVPGR
jgi:hypothetical protein